MSILKAGESTVFNAKWLSHTETKYWHIRRIPPSTNSVGPSASAPKLWFSMAIMSVMGAVTGTFTNLGANKGAIAASVSVLGLSIQRSS